LGDRALFCRCTASPWGPALAANRNSGIDIWRAHFRGNQEGDSAGPVFITRTCLLRSYGERGTAGGTHVICTRCIVNPPDIAYNRSVSKMSAEGSPLRNESLSTGARKSACDRVKREVGASPTRSRHCDIGASSTRPLSDADGKAEEAALDYRAHPMSQETCLLRLCTASFEEKEPATFGNFMYSCGCAITRVCCPPPV